MISEGKDNTYKHLNEFKENTSRQWDEICKTKQDNEGNSVKKQKSQKNQIQILKMKSSVSQVKNLSESLFSAVEKMNQAIRT
jgi:hypothetical protein